MLARNIMSKNVHAVSPNTTVDEAVEIMYHENVEMVAVESGDRLLGILTQDTTTENMDLIDGDTTVDEIMIRDSYYCFEDQEIQDIAYMMGYLRSRVIPVLNRDYHLVGTLSIADFARSPSAWLNTGNIFKNYQLTG